MARCLCLSCFMQITLLSEHDYCDDYVVRNFMLRNTQTAEVHDVTQFHYLSWSVELPSVPESVTALLEFRRLTYCQFVA